MSNNNVAKLCFTSLYSYALFNPTCTSPFGGAEVQIALIAKGLAQKERFAVNVIVYDHDQPPLEERDKVTLVSWRGRRSLLQVEPEAPPQPGALARLVTKLKSESAPAPVRQLATGLDWRITSVYWALRKKTAALLLQARTVAKIGQHAVERNNLKIYDEVNADIYLMMGVSRTAADLAYYCRKKGKKYVMLAGSDEDFSSLFKAAPEQRNCYDVSGHLANYVIENASLHLVQNERQAQLLRQQYGFSSTIVRNPINLTKTVTPSGKARSILWVGKADQVKRPELILRLARAMPEYQFTLILSLSDEALYQRCYEEAAALPNVTIHNFVPYTEIEQYFADALLLVNTSLFEGFPNTFLQAAKYGVPVISYQLDPGDMLAGHGCGLSCQGDFALFRRNVELFLTDQQLYKETSAKCLKYVRAYHDEKDIVNQYEAALLPLLK